MALWTLYRNFKARYMYILYRVFKLEFQYHSGTKMCGVSLKISSEMRNLILYWAIKNFQRIWNKYDNFNKSMLAYAE